MLLFALGALLAGCQGDPCRTLCADVTTKMAACRDGWGYRWEDLGADSQQEYRSICLDGWEQERAGLPAREIADAEESCQDASTALADMSCDELRALYF